jgi:hypothetical protein
MSSSNSPAYFGEQAIQRNHLLVSSGLRGYGPSDTLRSPAAVISRARASVATPSQSSSPPQSTKTPGSCASILPLLIRRENGWLRTGRYALLAIPPRHSVWAQRSPMPAAMCYSRWSGSPERTISMHRTLMKNRNPAVRLSPMARMLRRIATILKTCRNCPRARHAAKAVFHARQVRVDVTA